MLPKIGDKMVVTKKIVEDDLPIGTVLTVAYVEEVYGDYFEIYAEEAENFYSAEQVEFENIYNSPLYQALREEQ